MKQPVHMPLVESLAVLRDARSDEVVVTTMGVSREWMALGEHPLDFNYVPSSMGQATSLGLGIALARPDRRVLVCNGDGSMLMNLGSLVTITARTPANLVLIVFDNGVYEVTGAQRTPGTAETRDGRGEIDFAGMARATGFRSVHEFDALERWRAEVGELLDAEGPTFVRLRIAPVPGAVGPKSPGPAPARAEAFARALSDGRE